jgi:ATP-dependent Zn protease
MLCVTTLPAHLPAVPSRSDEDYNMITRGRLLDRMRVALAGSTAVRLVLGEETNFAIADIKRVRRMAERYVFYYGMSDFGMTTWAQQPYSLDFAVGSNRCGDGCMCGWSAVERFCCVLCCVVLR